MLLLHVIFHTNKHIFHTQAVDNTNINFPRSSSQSAVNMMEQQGARFTSVLVWLPVAMAERTQLSYRNMFTAIWNELLHYYSPQERFIRGKIDSPAAKWKTHQPNPF